MSEQAKAKANALEAKSDYRSHEVRRSDAASSVPFGSPYDQILNLQQTVGNQAVSRLLGSQAIQAKLRVNPPDDIFEREADRVADQVLRLPSSAVSDDIATVKPVPAIHIQQLPEGNPAPLNRDLEENEEKDQEILPVREIAGPPQDPPADLLNRIGRLKGQGRFLPVPVRDFFESRFGYDFSRVQVHTDPEASDLARNLNARAFTVGNDIVFGSGQYAFTTNTGKRLLAHELAHVIQQSAPLTATRITSNDDSFGEAVEQATDDMTPGPSTDGQLHQNGSGQGPAANGPPGIGKIQPAPMGIIQRDTEETAEERHQKLMDYLKLPPGRDYQVREIGGQPLIVVRREWLLKDKEYDPEAKKSRAPTAIAAMLRELRQEGVLPNLTDEQIAEIARKLAIPGPIEAKDIYKPLALGIEALAVLGPTYERDFQWQIYGKGAALVIRRAILWNAPKAEILTLSRRAWKNLEERTGLSIPEKLRAFVADWLAERLLERRPPQSKIILGYVHFFKQKEMESLFGTEAWTGVLEKAKESKTKPGRPGGAARGEATSPDLPPDKGPPINYHPNISKEDREYFRAFLDKLMGDRPEPAKRAADALEVSQSLIDAARQLDQHPRKEAVLKLLKGDRGTATTLSAAAIRNGIAAVEFEASFEKLGRSLPAEADEDEKPILNEPVEGTIVNRSGLLHVGETAQFVFKTKRKAEAWRVPRVSVQWTLTPLGQPRTHLDRENTSYIESPRREPDYFDHTFSIFDLLSVDKKITRADLETNQRFLFTVHAQVDHNFYRPAYFYIPVEVKTEAARMAEMRTKEFAGMGVFQIEKRDFETSWFEENVGDWVAGDRYDVGHRFFGTLPTEFQRMSDAQRIAFIERERGLVENFIKSAKSKSVADYAQDYLKSLKKAEKTLQAELDQGYTFFETRGAFLSRKGGVPDKPLHLVSTVMVTEKQVKIRIHDFTKLTEPRVYTFTGQASTFEAALETAFLKLSKSYPPGRMSLLAEQLNSHTLANPKGQTVGFELDTGSTWKDIKSTVWNPTVQMVVNIAGMAIMIFVPVATPFVFPLLVAYNATDTLDNLSQLKDKGLLTDKSIATGLASIGLDLLPYVGRAKKLFGTGKKAWFIIEGIDLAGQVAIMTIDGLEQVEHIRSQHVRQLAELQARITHLEDTNPSHPDLDELRAQRDELIAEAQTAGLKAFGQMVATHSIMILTPKAFGQLTGHGTRQQIDALIKDGSARHDPNIDKPYYDPQKGEIVVNKDKVTDAELEQLRDEIAEHQAAGEQRGSAPSPTAESLQVSLASPEVWRYGGRDIVIVNTPRGRKAFYRRTGNSDRGVKFPGAQAGDWAPFDGFEPQPGGAKFSKHRYAVEGELRRFGTEEFRRISQWLKDQNIGPGRDVGQAWGEVQQHLEAAGVPVEYPLHGGRRVGSTPPVDSDGGQPPGERPPRGGGEPPQPPEPPVRALPEEEARRLSIALDESGRPQTAEGIRNVSWIPSRDLYETLWQQATGRPGHEAPPFGFVDRNRNEAIINRRPDILDPGGRVEREVSPTRYAAREHMGETNRLGDEEPRYYAVAHFNEGIIEMDFVLRRPDVPGAPGYHRSSRLRGRDEFNRALAHFRSEHGESGVRGIRGDWSGGDNLRQFNEQFRVHLAEGRNWNDALRQAARETHTGRWAAEAGFTAVRIDRERYNSETMLFDELVVTFLRVNANVMRRPPRPRGRMDTRAETEQLPRERADTQVETEPLPRRRADTRAETEPLPRERADTRAETEPLPRERADTRAETEPLPRERADTRAETEPLPRERADTRAETEPLPRRRADTRADTEPPSGELPESQPWWLRGTVPHRSRKFNEAQAELQPILDEINPCAGTQNCVPVTIATDLSIAQGVAFKAPVVFERTGFQGVETSRGTEWLPRYEEVPGYPQMRLESYVGAEMKKGASALWRDLSRAGDGARAIVIDESLSEGIRHAYNVINWRGMIIALDGQTRVMVPFGQVLGRMRAMGEDSVFEWYRTN